MRKVIGHFFRRKHLCLYEMKIWKRMLAIVRSYVTLTANYVMVIVSQYCYYALLTDIIIDCAPAPGY